jgi:hypothetical protein
VLFAAHEGGEAGVYDDHIALYADDGSLDRATTAVPGVSVSSREECRAPAGAGCERVARSVLVGVAESAAGWPGWTMPGEVRVHEGETAAVPGTFVRARLVRASEDVCGAPRGDGAFVLLWSFPPAP